MEYNKDYPKDFDKSWKKLERYCKKTKTKCYVTDVESGAACSLCYVRINWKNWSSLKGPKVSFSSRKREVLCRQCYNRRKSVFWSRAGLVFFIVLVVLFFFLAVLFGKRINPRSWRS